MSKLSNLEITLVNNKPEFNNIPFCFQKESLINIKKHREEFYFYSQQFGIENY